MRNDPQRGELPSLYGEVAINRLESRSRFERTSYNFLPIFSVLDILCHRGGSLHPRYLRIHDVDFKWKSISLSPRQSAGRGGVGLLVSGLSEGGLKVNIPPQL